MNSNEGWTTREGKKGVRSYTSVKNDSIIVRMNSDFRKSLKGLFIQNANACYEAIYVEVLAMGFFMYYLA